MALDTAPTIAPYDAPVKDLYEIGEMPPLGHVPKQMYAWAIRRERHGPPEQSMQLEVVDTWTLDSNEVLVMVMAAGVNYNGVWAGLGQSISPFDNSKLPYFIVGSDAAGIVWAVGDKVKRWKVGDEVVIHCNQDDGDDEECNGGDPMFSPSQRIWGYETPDGSFAQFCRVQSRQLLPRPKHLTWEEAACYTLTLATAYRMRFGHKPHELKPGQNVLVWGASGGLGVYAIQLINTAGANAIGVISDESKRDFVLGLNSDELMYANFATTAALARTQGNRIVPGYGPPVSADALDLVRDYIAETEARVRSLFDADTPLSAIVHAAHLPRYAGWAMYEPVHGRNVQQRYLALERTTLAE